MKEERADQQFLQIMERLLADGRFKRAAALWTNRHWMDAQTLRESNFSDLFAWLLNPREGHGLGSYFIRRLIHAAMTDDDAIERVNGWVANGAWPRLSELDELAFDNALVAREVITPGTQNRIDLVVADPINRLLLVIERKDGAKLSESQLRAYEKWANEAYGEFRQLWLVLDSQEGEHRHINANWLQLGDTWLVEALSDVVAREQLPERIERQLNELRLRLSGQYFSYDDPYYNDLDQDLAVLTQDFRSEFSCLRELRVPGDAGQTRYLDITDRVAIGLLPQFASRGAAAVARTIGLAACYRGLLAHLADNNRLSALAAALQGDARYQDRLITRITRNRAGTDSLYISLKRFAGLDEWPFVLAIDVAPERTGTMEGTHGVPTVQLRFGTRIDPGTTMPRDMWPALAQEFRRDKRQQKWIQTERESLSELSLPALEDHLDRLIELDKRIGMQVRQEEAQR